MNPLSDAIAAFEADYIRRAFAKPETNGHAGAVAVALGISEDALTAKIVRLSIKAAPGPNVCARCVALTRERETVIEELALHEFDHDKDRLERIASDGMALAVDTYVLSRERAIRERAEVAMAARLKKRARKKGLKALLLMKYKKPRTARRKRNR